MYPLALPALHNVENLHDRHCLTLLLQCRSVRDTVRCGNQLTTTLSTESSRSRFPNTRRPSRLKLPDGLEGKRSKGQFPVHHVAQRVHPQ